ncbi:unnamed protein product [Discula destructiva]
MHALLNPRLKLWLHIVEVCFILPIIILTLVRVSMGMSLQGGGRMGLAFGAKSLVFITYQLLTQHVKALKRWRSAKANAIINGAEIVFWIAVVYLVIAANLQTACTGTVCTLGWVEVVFAIFMVFLSVWVFSICYVEFRQYRANGNKYPEELDMPTLPKSGYENVTSHYSPSHSPEPTARHPMVQPHYHNNHNNHNNNNYYNSNEYHSGYTRTPASMV